VKRVGQVIILIFGIAVVIVMNWHYQQLISSVMAHYEHHEKNQIKKIKSLIEQDFNTIDLYVEKVAQQVKSLVGQNGSSKLSSEINQLHNKDTLLSTVSEVQRSIALLDMLVIQRGDNDLNYALLSGGISNIDSLHLQKHYEWLDKNRDNRQGRKDQEKAIIISNISDHSPHHFLYSVQLDLDLTDARLVMMTMVVSQTQLQKSLMGNYYLQLDGVKHTALDNDNNRSFSSESELKYYEKMDAIGGRKLWGEWVVGTAGDLDGYHSSLLTDIDKNRTVQITIVIALVLLGFLIIEYNLFLRRRLLAINKNLETQVTKNNVEIDAIKENSYALSHDLLKIELRLHSVLDATTDGVIVCDNAGVITNINSIVIKMFGYHENEVVGKKIDFIFPELSNRVSASGDSFLERITANSEQSLIEVNAISKNNSFMAVELYGKRVKVNEHEAYSIIIRDISERVKNEGQLRDVQKNLRAIIDNIEEGVVTFDLQGIIQAFNPAAEHIFKWSSEDVIGQRISKLMTDRDSEEYSAYLKNYHDIANNNFSDVAPQELVGIRNNGDIFHMEITTSEMFSGRERFFISIVRDVTERKIVEKNMDMSYSELESMVDSHTNDLKKMNNELVKARDDALVAARSKSEFLAMMSHEIRTPINGLLGMLSLVRETELNDEQSDYVETAYTSGEMLLELLNNVLDVSKIDAGRMTLDRYDFDVHQLVENSAQILSKTLHNRDIEVICYIAHNVPQYVCGDAGRLRQILTNLMSNAGKFTDKGSIIVSLGMKNFSDGEYRLNFDIADTGIGIDDVNADSIFDEFSQADNSERRHYGGTGLGLSICRKFVSMMDGELVVDSMSGIGSTFSFNVCLGQSDKENSVVKLNGHRVLLLSASEVRCHALEKQFEEWGCVVHQLDPNEVLHGFDFITLMGDEIIIVDGSGVVEGCVEFVEQLAVMFPDKKLSVLFIKDEMTASLSPIIDELTGKVVCINKQILPSVLFSSINILQNNTAMLLNHEVDHSSVKQAEDACFNGLSVLVAEDNIVNQKIIVSMLTKIGVTVCVVSNGQEALDVLSNRGHGYHVVLMDCQMPELDGYAATRKLRLIEKCDDSMTRVPIIAMTAHALPGDREKCIDAGMDEYLTKPIKINTVKEMIKCWM